MRADLRSKKERLRCKDKDFDILVAKITACLIVLSIILLTWNAIGSML